MGFKTYDASQVTMVFLGLPITSGYADGDFVEVSSNEDDYKMEVGTDGEVTRSATNNRTGTVKLHLMQTSSGNAILSTARQAGLIAKNGADVGPMIVKDNSGASVFLAGKCWIQKPPDSPYGREAQARVWTIAVADLVRYDGGN